MGLGEAVDAAIPKSHIPSPKSNFLEIKRIISNAVTFANAITGNLPEVYPLAHENPLDGPDRHAPALDLVRLAALIFFFTSGLLHAGHSTVSSALLKISFSNSVRHFWH